MADIETPWKRYFCLVFFRLSLIHACAFNIFRNFLRLICLIDKRCYLMAIHRIFDKQPISPLLSSGLPVFRQIMPRHDSNADTWMLLFYPPGEPETIFIGQPDRGWRILGCDQVAFEPTFPLIFRLFIDYLLFRHRRGDGRDDVL
jgi:hypothetical protein